jgi:transcriptional regulator GlxA family with amidase domain
MTYVDDYVIEKLPSVRYLLTICTGAIFAARGGVFNNRRATTTKNAWNLVTAHGENVTWVAPARFVIDDNLWSSSGVSEIPSTQGLPRLLLHYMRCANDGATGYV